MKAQQRSSKAFATGHEELETTEQILTIDLKILGRYFQYTLRLTAQGVVYPVAELCAQVWLNSPYINSVDVHNKQAMCTTSGTIKATPTNWLPALSQIATPHIHHKYSGNLLDLLVVIKESIEYICNIDVCLWKLLFLLL